MRTTRPARPTTHPRPRRPQRSRLLLRRGALVVAVVALLGLLPPPPAQAAPPPLPDDERRSPAITASEPGRTDLFWRTSSGRLAHRYRPAGGSWSRQLDLGGAIASQPAVVSWAPGEMDIFARGTDNRLKRRFYRNGRWSTWRSLGGALTSAPAAASWERGRLDVFARGTDGALRHRTYVAGQGWSKWYRRGGALRSSPAATSWGPGRLDVVARGRNGTLMHRHFVKGRGWSAWHLRGKRLSSQPAIASPDVGQLDVVARRGTQAVSLRRFVRGKGWSAWTSLGGRFVGGPSATADGRAVRLTARRTGGAIAETYRGRPERTFRSWRTVDALRPFRRLSTWVDVFDYATLDPEPAVRDMADRGVRTLFLATARFTDSNRFHDAAEAGEWLDAAHARGIKVVGWYLPAYGNMRRDVLRTVAIAEFTSPGGQRFDGVGVDIERLDEVSRAQFNVRLVNHLTRVREQVDPMIAAIVPSPFATDPGTNWAGLPWAEIGRRSDVVVPMALWSFRDNCPGPERCPYSGDQVYAWVLDQTRRARELSGRPVTVEGGVNDPGTENTPVTATRVRRFVDAVIDGGAIGGSHYDYATTPDGLWPILRRLNEL